MLSSLLNFSFLEALGAEDEKWGTMSVVSGATSPMSAVGTPGVSPIPADNTHPSTSTKTPRTGRRSSVFFRIPEGDPQDRLGTPNHGRGISLTKLSKSLSPRRRASILPKSSARPQTPNTNKTTSVTARPVGEDATKRTPERTPSKSSRPEAWRGKGRGELLRTWEHEEKGWVSPASGPSRSSSRALSEGHRRQSTRDDSSKRSPKGLSARQLLEDAKDVARIREQARLRPAHQGLCWVASNWRVGGKQGVLSGRRCLVLCDSMVWAELKPADRDALGQPIQDADTEERKGGFLPIMSLNGATLQHCEVAKSNNGWIIEVVNQSSKVTLWLDPETPTSMLKWGSVLCQAIESARSPIEEEVQDFFILPGVSFGSWGTKDKEQPNPMRVLKFTDRGWSVMSATIEGTHPLSKELVRSMGMPREHNE